MKDITDEQLLNELKSRFEQNFKLMKELRHVNKKLEESEVLKSQFLSNIRNEINNPFAAIMGLSKNILSMKADDFQRVRRSASMIFEEAFKLDFQLNNIFAAAEVEAGEIYPQIQQTPIDKVLHDVIDSFSHKAGQKNIKINPVAEIEESYTFNTDGEMLKLIVANLLSNAIEFSTEGSEVSITKIQLENGLLITVEDQGIGIDPSDQEVIFDRFRQVDQGPSKNFQGHGLGLSVAKSYTEILNGDLDVESLKNGGSKFLLFLPAVESFSNEEFGTNEDGIFL